MGIHVKNNCYKIDFDFEFQGQKKIFFLSCILLITKEPQVAKTLSIAIVCKHSERLSSWLNLRLKLPFYSDLRKFYVWFFSIYFIELY